MLLPGTTLLTWIFPGLNHVLSAGCAVCDVVQLIPQISMDTSASKIIILFLITILACLSLIATAL
jgi:hypothetical protein